MFSTARVLQTATSVSEKNKIKKEPLEMSGSLHYAGDVPKGAHSFYAGDVPKGTHSFFIFFIRLVLIQALGRSVPYPALP